MNKKETAEFEQLKHELRLAKALSWTQPVAPDVPLPEKWNELSTGYLYTAYAGFGGDSVVIACSSTTSHARGRIDKTTTQNARRLYSSRLLALKAMRYEVEVEVATRLAKIDEQIERELLIADSPNGTDA